ncbi:MAG: translation elongation factor Ts [Gammaproteobacteria bacterium]
MSISASLVKELRERTGSGMMECRNALVETNGDIEAAIELMRKSGQAKADKKANRVAAEGMIIVKISADKKHGVIVEINCETDFVARDQNFVEFAEKAADIALNKNLETVDSLSSQPYVANGETVEQVRQQLVAKLGENVNIRRVQLLKSDGCLGAYMHGTRIGVLVALNKMDEELGKDLAMHIAANSPLVVSPDQVSQDLVAKEREIFSAQAQASGKPADIISKMVEGRIKKYLDEVSLLGQPFVKNPDISVSKLLQEKSASVNDFIRFAVGEGIEKQVSNFAEEVMAQVKGS